MTPLLEINEEAGRNYSKEKQKCCLPRKKWTSWKMGEKGIPGRFPTQPMKIHGVDSILKLLKTNQITSLPAVAAALVMRNKLGQISGVEAVIDKDRTGKKLAEQLDAERLVILLTDVSNIYINYKGNRTRKNWEKFPLKRRRVLLDEGRLRWKRVGPKMEAAIDFAARVRRNSFSYLL